MFAYRHQLKQTGIILLEVMLAVALSLLMLSGLLEMVIAIQHQYQLQAAIKNIADNATTAIDILSAALHQSGHIGCPRLTDDFIVAELPPYSMTVNNKIAAKNNHEMTVRFASFPAATLTDYTQDKFTLLVTTNVPLATGDILLISDCKHAELLQAKSVSMMKNEQKIITTTALHYQYDKFSEVSKLEVNRYFIDKAKDQSFSRLPLFSLFVEDIYHHKVELVEGITAMNISYLIKQRNEYFFQSADGITDWSSVKGVSIELSLATYPINKRWHVFVALEK